MTTLSATGVVNLAPFSFFNLLGDVGAEGPDERVGARRRAQPRRDARRWARSAAVATVRPPRVKGKGSPVQFEWRLHQVVRLPGHRPSSGHDLVIDRVVAVHIDDTALTGDGRLDLPKVKPIARLGYQDYAAVESTSQMVKRTPEALLRVTRSE